MDRHNFHDHRPLLALVAVLAVCLITFVVIPYGMRKAQERRDYDRINQCHPTDKKKTTIIFNGKTTIPLTKTLWRCEKTGETFWG
jgi:hypothetical protein